jgi:hypothetical protein
MPKPLLPLTLLLRFTSEVVSADTPAAALPANTERLAMNLVLPLTTRP